MALVAHGFRLVTDGEKADRARFYANIGFQHVINPLRNIRSPLNRPVFIPFDAAQKMLEGQHAPTKPYQEAEIMAWFEDSEPLTVPEGARFMSRCIFVRSIGDQKKYLSSDMDFGGENGLFQPVHIVNPRSWEYADFGPVNSSLFQFDHIQLV